MTLANDFQDTGEADPLQSVNGRPALQLPGAGHRISNFASELGAMLQGHNIFALSLIHI